jgi:hypothetical protein
MLVINVASHTLSVHAWNIKITINYLQIAVLSTVPGVHVPRCHVKLCLSVWKYPVVPTMIQINLLLLNIHAMRPMCQSIYLDHVQFFCGDTDWKRSIYHKTSS